ncbi:MULTISPECIES: hypothetical protein [Vibrio harveyi group]|uniref:Uncharacterized protein n=1 Tax=Vibrio campbellii TaxID=680 RepID=A0AAE9MZM2_9VIBR|nr:MULTISPECIES: hypothetical protein [Vibrio harveyi group]APP04942.1 hypothetical protein BG259_06130 [Vibrio harveyi]UTZ24294.1 hypothetical protein HB760_21415 [Vibrio campbellii]UTZ27776.1 hypothetical protein HB761_14095 [Vibrio campbellii]UTZ27800.1 hypothetical protein HB761_14255 [Vibrio campbellii]UTZ33571.1 hypothetical protein HB762_20060 [Vibrio campbellii]
MDKNQGIIEFLAMSGILPLAVFVLLILGGIAFVLLVIFVVSKSKTDSKSRQDDNEFQKLETYYDPRLPERSCPNCSSSIRKGKVVCGSCGKLDSSVIST